MRDISNNVNIRPAFPPVAAVTTNAVQTSTILDTYCYGAAMLAVVTGTLTGPGTFAGAMIESNDPAMAGSNSVAAVDMTGTPTLASFDFSSNNVCRKIGYIGNKRYLQATATPR